MTRRSRLPTPLLLAVVAAVIPAGIVAAQDSPPTADRSDVASLDAVMAAVYDVISGPAGEARDWDRFRSLFIDGARLIPTGRPEGATAVGYRVMTPDEYATRSGPVLEERGFFEREIGRAVERYGPVVHVMSAYESRTNEADAEPFARGVNSFQLLNDGERWWIVTIYWSQETPDNPIPARLLGG
jgi:hypothetical protein